MSDHSRAFARAVRRVLPALAGLAMASPALADHPAPASLTGGASLNVLDPETLESGGFGAGLRVTYTRPDQRSDAELAALAGRHIHAHNSDYNLSASLGLAYGLSDRLTIAVELPYVRRDALREGEHSHSGGQAINEVVRLGSVAGIGDASIVAKYRPVDGLALIAGLKLPTGSTRKRGNDGERLETEHQPGTGSWDPIAGAAVGTRLGLLRLNASLLYQWPGKGAQHTRLGDRAQGGLALSRRFGPADHHDEGGDHRHSSWDAFVELTGEWEGRQRVDGELEEFSGGKSLWVSPGARYTSASGLSVAASVGLPLWQRIRASHPDNDWRLTLAVGKAF